MNGLCVRLSGKFRADSQLHWLVLICWTCGVIALTAFWLAVRS